MKKYRVKFIVLILISFFISRDVRPQEKSFHMLESWSINFVEDEDWGDRYELRRQRDDEKMHLNDPPGWTTFDAVYTDRDGYNRIKKMWPAEDTPGYGEITDWYVEWKINIEPFSIGQGCMTEFHYAWGETDPEADPDFQEPTKFSVDFSLGYIHKYYSKLEADCVWLCGSDIQGHKYGYYEDATGWIGIPIIMRLRKTERTLYFEVRKEEDTEFTILYQMPCNIYAVLYYTGWSLSTTGEWGATPSTGLPWSGKAQYFRVYTNAEIPVYGINFADADSLGPFIVVPGTELPDKYSFTENPGWLRIHTEYASGGIAAAKNQLIQPFVPNFMSDFYIIVHVTHQAEEAGQGFGMKLTLLASGSTKEVVCYWGKSNEALVGYPGGDFFAAGLKGEERLTDAAGISGPIYIRIVRVGTDLYIDYTTAGSSSTGNRRLATLSGMEGGLLNLILAAGNFAQWGATEGTGSTTVDIRSIDIDKKAINVTPYYTMDNDFNNGLEPFEIPIGQKNVYNYSLNERPGWYRIQTEYHDGDLSGAKNVLKQSFLEPVNAGISVEIRVDVDPVEEGQVFGMQLNLESTDGTSRTAILRFGKTSSSVTGDSFTKFFEYGYEGESIFVDATSIGSILLLRIERYADKFIFSYAAGSDTEYTVLGSVKEGMGQITDVLFGAANLSGYGATVSTPSMTVDVDYFRYLQNMIANGQCEFTDGIMPWPWTLSNVDSAGFSLTERDGWLKVMTLMNTDFQGRVSKCPNAVRAGFGSPHPGIEGDFDFTVLMNGCFSETGQAVDIVLGTESEDLIFRYGIIGEGEIVPKFEIGVDSVQVEQDLADPDSILGFRIIRQDSTILFMYLPGGTGSWIQITEKDSGLGTTPVRNVTVAAHNVVAYGATEATSSAEVYFDYIRFNRIDDYLTGVEERYLSPEGFVLYQNYPNPFNPETKIKYNLPKITDVKLEIYNILGQRVRTLVDERQITGQYTVIWNGRNDADLQAASGVYISLFRAGKVKITRKMILLK